MPSAERYAQTLQEIQALIDDLGDHTEPFADRLREHGLTHISFSQIKSIEFCQAEYAWKYIYQREPTPTPAYFIKGKLLHQAIAASYNPRLAQGDPTDLLRHPTLDEEHRTHLQNAYATHRQNLWESNEILGIEQPFVISLDFAMPPVVGVIDLILRGEDGGLVLVDHKTGRDFAEQDALQLAIYQRYAAQRWGTSQIRFYYDHYRWVRNLGNIRKPAMLRQEVRLSPSLAAQYMQRIQFASDKIDRLRSAAAKPGFRPQREGSCYICAFRKLCYG